MTRWLIAVFCMFSLVSGGLRGAQADIAFKAERSAADAKRPVLSKADYVLQPLDVLKVQVLQEEEINRLGDGVRISQEHEIQLPLIGKVDLKGKTAQQAREIIRQRYDRDYLVDPQVQVQVVEYSKRYVSVLRQVMTPGQVQFPPEEGLTLVEAISRAGGPTRLANMKKVSLKRTNPDGTSSVVHTIDVDELTKSDTKGETWPLQQGDVITVPERSI